MDMLQSDSSAGRQTSAAPSSPGSLCKLPRYEPLASVIRQKLESRFELAALMRFMTLDPAIAAEILVAANSPVYGFASRVYTVPDAVMILGWEQAERILRAAVSCQLVPNRPAELVVEASWAHSLAAACYAAELAALFDMAEERAFTIALMHDIGRLGILTASPVPYLDLVAGACANPLEFLESEGRRLRMDHCKAGMWLARVWGLPAEFCDATAQHHGACPASGQAAVVVSGLACRLAHAAGYGVETCPRQTTLEAISYARPEIARRLTKNWGNISANSHTRLVKHTAAFCDIRTMSRAPSRIRSTVGCTLGEST